MTIKPWDLNPLLMMQPGLNRILYSANEYHADISKKMMELRRKTTITTCIYHTVLETQLKEASILKIIRGKPCFKTSYLGNIEIEYLPNHAVWKIQITNGRKKRKNSKIPYEVKETLFLRKLQGNYIIDEEFQQSEASRQ